MSPSPLTNGTRRAALALAAAASLLLSCDAPAAGPTVERRGRRALHAAMTSAWAASTSSRSTDWNRSTSWSRSTARIGLSRASVVSWCSTQAVSTARSIAAGKSSAETSRPAS